MSDDEDKTPSHKIQLARELINKYRATYADIDLDVLQNLIELKDIASQPKVAEPEQAFNDIKDRLGDAEAGETLRQERWKNKIKCIHCGSKHVKRLHINEQKSPHIYKYACEDCGETFNDDSDTEIEKAIPPLYTWMFCWYLLGCSNSMQYIAQKLGLNLKMVEMMVAHMQKLFKTDQPLTKFMSFEEWSMRNKTYKEIIKDSIKKTELFRGFSVGQEQDTAEVRRQKNRDRNPRAKPRS